MASRRAAAPLRSLDALGALLPRRDGGAGDDASGAAAPLPPRPAAGEDPRRAAGAVRVGRESKGRAGKTVTLVRGLPRDEAALQALAQRLKTHCGAGGTVRDGVVEVQGDHVDRVVAWLLADGFAGTRRAGG